MHADTGAWRALPEIPWTTEAGATFKELGRATARLLADIHAKLATQAGPVELALLADQLADLRVDLNALANSELVPQAIFKAAQASAHKARTPGPRDHLRLV